MADQRRPWTLPEDCARRDAALVEVERALKACFPDRWEELLREACYPKGRIAIIDRTRVWAPGQARLSVEVIPDFWGGGPLERVLVELWQESRSNVGGGRRQLAHSMTVGESCRQQDLSRALNDQDHVHIQTRSFPDVPGIPFSGIPPRERD
jgi:hypothetical protein